jgi:uncharacterized protein GlcG (DUF336 family)
MNYVLLAQTDLIINKALSKADQLNILVKIAIGVSGSSIENDLAVAHVALAEA